MHAMKDKVIVILGASSGIGEATVKLLASKGAKLVIASRREEKLKALADTLPERNFCSIAYHGETAQRTYHCYRFCVGLSCL